MYIKNSYELKQTPQNIVYNFFKNNYINLLWNKNRKIKNNFVSTLYCHYVFDDQRKLFANILKHLLNIGEFISTPDLVRIIKEELIVEGRYFHLSFDDGFKNILTNALPILVDKKIPAIIFIPTGYIESDYQKSLYFSKVVTNYQSPIEFLTWEDIYILSNNNIEIGSHTVNHCNLANVNKETLELEITFSQKVIEKKIMKKCKYISWPYGTQNHFNEDARILVTKEYEACFGAFRGNIHVGKTDIYSIPRNHFEPNWPFNNISYFIKKTT